MLIADAPTGAPTAEAVMARAATENFPVASRLLPAHARSHLLAVYGFARLVDELGDTGPLGEQGTAERLAALDWLSEELHAAFRGQARHQLLVRLQPTLRECNLSDAPFERLIEANRVDQRVSRYETWAQLRDYCALSADPVGELVLEVLGLSTPQRVAWSDSICTALQLVEHCQDVAEDLRRGRIYLPLQDMRRFGCQESDLHAPKTTPALRELMAFEVARAHELLDQGMPLVAQTPGRARLALAAFVAGGRSALGAIERARYDVLAGAPRASSLRRTIALGTVLREARGSAP